MKNKKIIVAIDTRDRDQALNILIGLDPKLCMVKIGSVNFNSLGSEFIEKAYEKGFNVFLDLKLHDIPNTVKKSILGMRDLPIQMLTIHISGGLDMMRAAMEAVDGTNILIFGVTALTSLSDIDSERIFQRDAYSQVSSMLDLAEEGGIHGVVLSPHELKLVTQRQSLLSITPGIRLHDLKDDQKRFMTPKEAVDLGADFIVIGRPITASNDIKKSLNEIYESIV
ncbi:MAG: orotidine-5'-phosphate decarboxylase [Gammaproteobacteria bacterium]|nr:orotidine-5'-phosphate decarboxylase [Gammaproteobacteria bacterium]